MKSENLKVFYIVSQFGKYYRINKIGVIENSDDENDETNRDPEDTTAVIKETAKPIIMAEYLYLISSSYAQSIVEKNDDENNEYRFGLLLINSFSNGTFVFSANELDNNKYLNKNGEPFDYNTLLYFFAVGERNYASNDSSDETKVFP